MLMNTRRTTSTSALKRLALVTPSDRKLGTSREIANAAYRAFRLGTITKRQAYALGVVGVVLMKPLDERSELRRCRGCGGAGHNVRTCVARQQVSA